VILIAEPWDLGTYQVGNFPVDWSEWNGRFRDTARRFVKGDAGQLADLGWRLTGSADLYGEDGRSGYNSVNFITCHDGLRLLIWCRLATSTTSETAKTIRTAPTTTSRGTAASKARPPTQASWPCAAADEEPRLHAALCLGHAHDPGRRRVRRSQGGNNNAYCQDNPTNWFDWDAAFRNSDLIEFFRKAIAFTRRYPRASAAEVSARQGSRRRRRARPHVVRTGPGRARVARPRRRILCCQLDSGEDGAALAVDRLFFILNAHFEPQWVTLPPLSAPRCWYRAIDTSLPAGEDFAEPIGRSASTHPIATSSTTKHSGLARSLKARPT